MSAKVKVEFLKKYKRVSAKNIKEVDAILTEAWNQGINAQADSALGGWLVTIKR